MLVDDLKEYARRAKADEAWRVYWETKKTRLLASYAKGTLDASDL